ncbi:hypothetical protein ACIQ9Q_36745 [Streptomyces sp. NPDC094438]|uniref:hypothetical protein n=1 Tax=Streptomyces sp. NPDC094438 TaxID=3366061 RepID=UPI00382A0299
MDLGLPDPDGLDIARALRAEFPELLAAPAPHADAAACDATSHRTPATRCRR